MKTVRNWLACMVALLALAGPALADVSASVQNPSAPSVDARLSSLFGADSTSLMGVAPQQLEKITKPVVKTSDSVIDHIQYTDAWLATLPVATGGEEWACLAKAIYFEARGESVEGEFAVGEVIANRVDSPDFPHSICAVINQGTGQRYACQFSFACDGRPDVIRDEAAYEKAGKIAKLILDGAPRVLTKGATYFHTVWVHPGWSRRFEETAAIGAHVFYRDPVLLATN
ncbi:MAG: cell wall hydrolase [Paracoccaceae bacterium]|nr:cell wall hydrolase [Paracoccaceae bacterium]MDE3123400.1 cell wall hydrolase [Paracoccaceae bacterium]MDE3237802.1 cell wall hydrolase [Paracoccaceae bacterium]